MEFVLIGWKLSSLECNSNHKVHIVSKFQESWSKKQVTGQANMKNNRIMCTIGGLGRYSGRHIDRYIGRLSTDYRPIVGRQSVDYRPIVGRQSTDCRPIVDR